MALKFALFIRGNLYISHKSDRKIKESIENKYLNEKIGYYVNDLDDGTQECSAIITINNYYYYIHGCIQAEEFREILRFLFLY